MGARQRQPERKPELAGRRIDARSLTDAFIGNRRKGVVVELRYQQSKARSRNDQRNHKIPTRVGSGHHRDQQDDPNRQEQEPGARSQRPGVCRLSCIAIANMLNERGAIERPDFMALYSSTIWKKIGKTIIAPPSASCCSICWPMPILEGGRDRRRAARVRRVVSAGSASKPGQRATQRRSRSMRQRTPHLLPDKDSQHNAAHAKHRQHSTHDVDATGPVCGTSLTA